MPAPELKRYGFFSIHDNGAPPDCRGYTTLIIFHGLGFHSAIFEKLFSLADELNIRLVTVNRPDYPGATPLSDKERMRLSDIAEIADRDSLIAANALLDYIKDNAKKAYDFLAEFISRENIPAEGGIILAGWSYGALIMLGLMANANDISSKKVDLRSYIRHVVLYDPPSFLLGYAPPPDIVNPFFDPSVTPGEAFNNFPHWISAYYAHGEDLTKLEYEALDHPLPTILSMDPSDVQRCLEIGPVLPGGSDILHIRLGVQLGVFAQLKEAAIYLDKTKKQDSQITNKWDDVEIKYVWCDQSVWEMTWTAVRLQADLDDSKKAGRATRKVDMVRLRGGNHFCHWDQPELALMGLLSGSSAASDIPHSKITKVEAKL